MAHSRCGGGNRMWRYNPGVNHYVFMPYGERLQIVIVSSDIEKKNNLYQYVECHWNFDVKLMGLKAVILSIIITIPFFFIEVIDSVCWSIQTKCCYNTVGLHDVRKICAYGTTLFNTANITSACFLPSLIIHVRGEKHKNKQHVYTSWVSVVVCLCFQKHVKYKSYPQLNQMRCCVSVAMQSSKSCLIRLKLAA